MFYTKSLLNC